MDKERELKVVTLMIEKYCKGNHKTRKHELCKECRDLLDYVKLRREKCPHENKVKRAQPATVLDGGFPPGSSSTPLEIPSSIPCGRLLAQPKIRSPKTACTPARLFSRNLCRGGGRFTGRKPTTTQAKRAEKGPRERRGLSSLHLKPFCSNCSIHCYKPDMREKIKAVMRYSGPRIVFSHPILAMRHLIESKRQKKKLNKERINYEKKNAA